MYGKWIQGWLEYDGGTIFKLKVEGDFVQNLYAIGANGDSIYVRILNDNIEFIMAAPDSETGFSLGKFKRGVSLESLPKVPWDSGSC